MSFKHLFSPHEIRGHEIRNRIFSTGHQTILAKNGVPSEEMAAYHEARARGGVGLIIMEYSRPITDDVSASYYINSSNDDCIPGYKLCADAVHKHGAMILGQIGHGGRIAFYNEGLRLVPNAPSEVPDNRFHCMPREMSIEYIHKVVKSFGQAARRMVEAGTDGVELISAFGMLMSQFLNPITNLRTDEYGGSEENRFRFISQCIAETRCQIGPDKILGMRIAADEMEIDGLDVEGWLKVCKRLNDEVELDYVNVIVGSMMGPGGSIHVVPPMQIENAYVAPMAGTIKAVMNKTVMVAGRINQPQQAEEVLAAGHADMIGMTRAMISDPHMPNKARAGNLDDIRACIACNQACIGHFQMGVPISCIQNPISGRELKLGDHAKAGERRTVLVAGGGPGGMKAAAVAAERGHKVILCEASAQLGGQVLLAQLLPERAEFGGLVGNLKNEMDKAGVDIRLNTRVDRALVEEINPDAVLVATGATPFHPAVDISDDVHSVDAWQVLRGEVNPGTNVVVADWRCDWVGLGVAEKLALEGCNVHLCINGETLGQNLQQYLRTYWAGAVHRLGIEVTYYARLFGADGDTVYFHHNASGEHIVCEGVDTLVLAQGHSQDTTLEKELRGMEIETHMIGDCLSPRSVEEAVYEGLIAARRI